MRRLLSIGILILSLVLTMIPDQTVMAATTITVDDDGTADFTTIQEALLAVSNGDTIFVHSGTYRGNINITKAVVIIGEDRDTTIIDGSLAFPGYGRGFMVSGQSSGTIENFTIQKCTEGISLSNSSGILIQNNRIINNTTDTGYGLFFYWSDNITVQNNDISYNKWGVYFDRLSDQNIIRNNNISYHSQSGIAITWTSNENTFAENDIHHNAQHGIFLYRTSDTNLLQDNTIANNGWDGIRLQTLSNNNVIRGNTIQENAWNGIRMLDNSRGNRIYQNNFIDNATQATVDPYCAGIFNEPAPAGGNHWSNWTSPDNDLDGFIDSPYVFTGGIDNLPWATLDGWINTPTPNQPPVADVGGPYSTVLGSSVTLNGSGSYDPDASTGDAIISYQWDIAGILTLDGLAPTLTAEDINALGVGVYAVSLTVADSFGASHNSNTTLKVALPPADISGDIEALISSFDEAASEGFLSGEGPGKSAEGRLGALRNMLAAARDLIEDGQYAEALEQLQNAYEKVDGNPQPPDFAAGDAADEIAVMILELIERLQD